MHVTQLLLALVICSAPASAQIPWQPHEPVQLASDEAGILVWATDVSGAVIQNARVVVANRTIGAENRGLTNRYGVFALRGLAPAMYDVTVTVLGFWDGETSPQLRLGTMLETQVVLNIRQKWQIVDGGGHGPITVSAIDANVDLSRELVSYRTLPFMQIEALAPASGDKPAVRRSPN